MHGIIFSELNKYVEHRLGAGAWEELLNKSQLKGHKFFPVTTYPDRELESIIAAICEKTGTTRDEVLEGFGGFIVPDLLRIYASLLNPNWKTLDLLENTETTMHRAVRYGDKQAQPPALVCERISPNLIKILYSSKRHMASFGIGIIKGIAEYFKEKIDISTNALPDDKTEITVKLLH